jgi:hypothetical protein
LRLRKEKEKVAVPNRKADDRKWLSHALNSLKQTTNNKIKSSKDALKYKLNIGIIQTTRKPFLNSNSKNLKKH